MDAYNLIGGNYSDSNLPTIQENLESGGDPNYELYNGDTLFMEAIGFPSQNTAVIGELITAGADINHYNHLGFTPLHCAVSHRKQEVVERLIQSGASINAKDFLGRTALHYAIIEGPDANIRIVKELLKHEEIDCNQVDFRGETPLMVAVRSFLFEIATLLLINNANPNIGDKQSVTPLHFAFSRPINVMAVNLLLGGASIYSVNEAGLTPFDVLILEGLAIRDIDTIRVILKLIAFKYSITSDLKRKLEIVPNLSQVFNQYCKEADHMRGDFIYGNITMHDFLYRCFVENDSNVLVHQIHKPVIERLARDIYPELFNDIFDYIPRSSLRRILQMFAVKYRREKHLACLLSILDINELISYHLSRYEIFDLIRAFYDVISE